MLYFTCKDQMALLTYTDQRQYKHRSCQNVSDALTYHLDDIYFSFGTNLYRQIIGIPMGTNCARLVADVFCILLCKRFHGVCF